MANEVKLTADEQELIGQMARLAERKAVGGVYINQGYSRSLGTPVLTFIALGDQAFQLWEILQKALIENESELKDRPSYKRFQGGDIFINDNGNLKH